MFYGLCFWSQQQEYTSFLLTGLLKGVSRDKNCCTKKQLKGTHVFVINLSLKFFGLAFYGWGRKSKILLKMAQVAEMELKNWGVLQRDMGWEMLLRREWCSFYPYWPTYLGFGSSSKKQVWPLTEIFSVSFLWKIIDLHGGPNQWPIVGEILFSSIPPSNSLVSISDPWRAFWANTVPSTRLVRCFRNYRESRTPSVVPRTMSSTTDANLDCTFVENPLFTPILDCEKSTE